jgi:hypothetical protein
MLFSPVLVYVVIPTLRCKISPCLSMTLFYLHGEFLLDWTDTKHSVHIIAVDPTAPPGGITVPAVYRLMSDSNVSVLLMDVRSCEDFSMSHIKSIDCISIPAECLKPGLVLSAMTSV